MATQAQTKIADWLDEREGRFIGIANEIWENPEVALTETKACRLQANDLAQDGFTITTGIAGLATAFVAEYSQGEGGPVIGFLGEYDALPGLSQERRPSQSPLVEAGPGHGCGHNLLGAAALAAAAVTKAWLEHTGKPGTVRYYGCPAEETVEGKNFMARAGVFDDLAVALTWHPGSANSATANSCLASDNVKFRFHGRTAHAAANPETGRSALDAVELMNVGVNFMREHMPEKARIHYVITNGGGAPNVVPDEAEVWYYVRSPERYQVNELTARVRKIAEGAALMTETTLEEEYISGIYNLLPNPALASQLMGVLEGLGPIDFTPDEKAFAQAIAREYPESLRRGVLKAQRLPESLLDEGVTGDVFPIRGAGEVSTFGTDVGDVSWVVPTGSIGTACFVLGTPGHSWANTATAGMSIGHKGMIHAAKAMAIAAANLISDPELIAAAKADFDAATKDQPYVSPIPEHVQPRQL